MDSSKGKIDFQIKSIPCDPIGHFNWRNYLMDNLETEIRVICNHLNCKDWEKYVTINLNKLRTLEILIRKKLKDSFKDYTNQLPFTSGQLRLLSDKLRNKVLKMNKELSVDNLDKLIESSDYFNYKELNGKLNSINTSMLLVDNLQHLANLFGYDAMTTGIREYEITNGEELSDEIFANTLRKVVSTL